MPRYQDQALNVLMTFYWRDGKMDQKSVSILFILIYEILHSMIRLDSTRNYI